MRLDVKTTERDEAADNLRGTVHEDYTCCQDQLRGSKEYLTYTSTRRAMSAPRECRTWT